MIPNLAPAFLVPVPLSRLPGVAPETDLRPASSCEHLANLPGAGEPADSSAQPSEAPARCASDKTGSGGFAVSFSLDTSDSAPAWTLAPLPVSRVTSASVLTGKRRTIPVLRP